mgnify:CR=1 FL=1
MLREDKWRYFGQTGVWNATHTYPIDDDVDVEALFYEWSNDEVASNKTTQNQQKNNKKPHQKTHACKLAS